MALAVILTSAALGQQPRPSIFELQLGTPAGELPEEEFVDPACGTNGGPPGLRLDGFEALRAAARKPPVARDLVPLRRRTEYIARAARDPDAVEHNNAMLMLGQPVILSLLVDPAGLVQGFRIFTDPHAEAEVRATAYTLAAAFKARFGADGWACNDLPPAAGETPVAGTFAKQLCGKVADGQQISVESRRYYKSGQASTDPNSGLATVNQFESAARIEVVQLEASRK